MASEEKIRAFLSNNGNIKALMNDEKFMGAVSGGQAAPETYKEKFKTFGLKLSDDEAKVIQKTVAKAIDTPTEKLDNSLLESITGGKVSGGDVAAGLFAGVALGTVSVVLAGLGMMMAGHIYAAKAKHAYNSNDDNGKSDEYLEKANKLDKLGLDTMTFGYTKMLRKHEGEKDFYDDFYLLYG